MFFVLVNIANAAFVITPDMINERYGFETDEENYVIINDKVKCEHMDFVYGDCVEQHSINLPCVPLDENVWEFENCCDNAEPYLKSGMDGQSRCQIVDKNQKFLDKTENIIKPNFIFSTLKDNTLT